MPLSYPSGTLAEHLACRSDAVVFDVSHLGTVRVEGPDAFARLQGSFTNDLAKVAPGRAQYTHLLAEKDASVLDDLIVWWVAPERFDVMPNASNTAGVREAVGGEDVTGERVVLAVQGPVARVRLSTVSPDAAAVPRFGVAAFEFAGTPCIAAGTGYTGRGRGRVRRAGRGGRRLLAGAARRGRRAGRARGARHPAPRGGAAAALPRARSGDHAAPGQSGLGRRVGQGRFPRSRGLGGRARGRGQAAPAAGSSRRGVARPAPATPATSSASGPVSSRAATSHRSSGGGSGSRSCRRTSATACPSSSTSAAATSRHASSARRSTASIPLRCPRRRTRTAARSPDTPDRPQR